MKKLICLLLVALLVFSACEERTLNTSKTELPAYTPPAEEKVEPKKPVVHIITGNETVTEPKTEPVIEPIAEEPVITETFTNIENPKLESEIDEVKAVWFSYLDFYELLMGKSEVEFRKNINTAFKNVSSLGLNTVIVHVRPFGDALYNSNYFPYSYVCTGTAGADPNFDPLKIMVDAAKSYNLKIEAWINPYRVKEENIVKTSWAIKNGPNDYFYDPGLEEVQDYIVSGVTEIIDNYDVNGIHFDDYFYPEGYTDNTYSDDERRAFVTALIRKTHNAIKNKNKNISFGISPQADLEKDYYKLYADIENWVKNGYIDYLSPQIYYGFFHETIPFGVCSSAWDEILKDSDISFRPGLAFYKSGVVDQYAGSGKNEWKENSDTIAAQIVYLRSLETFDGFILFRYDSIFNNDVDISLELGNMKSIMN